MSTNIHYWKAFYSREDKQLCALILCQQASWKSLSAMGTKKRKQIRDRGNFQNNIHFELKCERTKVRLNMLLHPKYYIHTLTRLLAGFGWLKTECLKQYCVTLVWQDGIIYITLYNKYNTQQYKSDTGESEWQFSVLGGLFLLFISFFGHFQNIIFCVSQKETIHRVCNGMKVRTVT